VVRIITVGFRLLVGILHAYQLEAQNRGLRLRMRKQQKLTADAFVQIAAAATTPLA
jgi:hypothetical protein